MQLLVQEYMRSGKSLEDLAVEHGIKSNITNGKISLNYDQIEANNGDQLACQCRGLVLRENTYEIVACPMFRFFNIEQKEFAADINWESARYEEKLDGTCLIVYFDDHKNTWCSATRSRAEADCGIDGSDVTFSILANEICNSMFHKINPDNTNKVGLNELMESTQLLHPNIDVKKRTFVFELTSPVNRIVCKYDDSKLTLIAVRNNSSLEEEDPNFWNDAQGFGVLTPELYYFNNISHMIEVIRSWDPKEHEGVVVKDQYWNRIKVKNPAYLAYNHMRDSLATSMRGCAEVILLGKDDDVVGMMPDMIANRIIKLKPAIAKVIEITNKDYDELKHIENMKEFALEAQKRLWPAALFALKRGKTPDLRTFSLGNRNDVSKIPQNATDTILELVKKIDPEILRLEI